MRALILFLKMVCFYMYLFSSWVYDLTFLKINNMSSLYVCIYMYLFSSWIYDLTCKVCTYFQLVINISINYYKLLVNKNIFFVKTKQIKTIITSRSKKYKNQR